jgi:salicylate hydroxylase
LEALGLRREVERAGFRPQGIAIHDGVTGRRLTMLPLGPAAESAYGAPYLTLPRASLQSLLHEALDRVPGLSIEAGFELIAAGQDTGSVTIQSADGRTATGTALIAADGLWSRVRTLMGAPAPAATPYAAYRATIPAAQAPGAASLLPPAFQAPEIGLWLGREAHAVVYPVAQGTALNVVVIVRSSPGLEGYDEPGATSDVARHLRRWTPCLRQLLDLAPEWRRWSVFTAPQTDRWAMGRILRIGDAAHPVLPFLAQGAVMALEDAVVLANVLAAQRNDPAAAFARFEALRRTRVARVARTSARNGRAYHLAGLPGLARNAILLWSPPERLLSQYDWLYRHDASRSGTT